MRARIERYRSGWQKTAELGLAQIALGGPDRETGPFRREMAKAAQDALSKADEDEKKVYQAEYMDGLSSRSAAERLGISQRTYYRIRDRLLDKVADEMRR